MYDVEVDEEVNTKGLRLERRKMKPKMIVRMRIMPE